MTSVFKILGDETRLRILSLLKECELAVHEIMEIIGKNQSAVSNQLAMLKNGGFIQSRKEGTKIYYSVVSNISHETEGEILATFFKNERHNSLFQSDMELLQKVLDNRKKISIEHFDDPHGEHLINPGDTWETLALGILTLIKGKTIIDLGCGSGVVAIGWSPVGESSVRSPVRSTECCARAASR